MGDGKVARSYLTRYSYYRYRGLSEPSARTETEPIQTEKHHLGRTHLPSGACSPLGTVAPLRQQMSREKLSRPMRLATLLQNTLGLMRYEVGVPRPLHRGTPSPRCLYASELYICLLEEGWGATPGAYRYNPLHHALEKKSGETTSSQALAVALGDGERSKNISMAVVVGAEFWRIACYYSDFAFHLAALECGQAAGQLELLCERLGWSVELVECFWEEPLFDALGIDPQAETALMVLLLRERTIKGQTSERSSREVAHEGESSTDIQRPAPITPLSKYHEDISSCHDLQAILQASRYRSPQEIPAFTPATPAELLAPTWTQKQDVWGETDLSDAIWRRSSGNDMIGLSQWALPLRGAGVEEFWQGLTQEVASEAQALGIEVYLAVHAVEGVESGFYRGAEQIVASRQVGPFLAELSTVSDLIFNPRQLPLSVFLAADFQSMINRYGDRGYQMAVLRSGRVAQWIALLAAAQGWWARTLKSYDDSLLEKQLGMVSHTSMLVCQIAIGEHSAPFLSFDLRI